MGPRSTANAWLPLCALSLALTVTACSLAADASDDGRGTGEAVAEGQLTQAEPLSVLPIAPAADFERPSVAGYLLDIASYAQRNGYYLKNGWWWLDAGHGVLHALYDEDNTYGIGLMMSTKTSQSRTRQAVDQMGTALYELELGSQFALDLMDFYQRELARYADTLDAEHSSTISLHGREVEVSFWWSESQVGSAVGTMLDVAKP